MASPRRIGAPDAKNRTALLDAAEQLILDQGYAASPRARWPNTPVSNHNWCTITSAPWTSCCSGSSAAAPEQGLELQEQLMRGRRPLHALRECSTDPAGARITMEFIGLADHNPAVRAEVAHYAEKFRDIQIETLGKVLEAQDIDAGKFPRGALAALMTNISRIGILEQTLGMSGGHAETLELVRRELERIEGPPAQDNATDTSRGDLIPPSLPRPHNAIGSVDLRHADMLSMCSALAVRMLVATVRTRGPYRRSIGAAHRRREVGA